MLLTHAEYFAVFIAAFCGTLAAIPFWYWLEGRIEDFHLWRARRSFDKQRERERYDDDLVAWPTPRDEQFSRLVDEAREAAYPPPPDHVTLRPRG